MSVGQHNSKTGKIAERILTFWTGVITVFDNKLLDIIQPEVMLFRIDFFFLGLILKTIAKEVVTTIK